MRNILIFVVVAVVFGFTIYNQMQNSQLQTQAPQQQTQENKQSDSGATPSGNDTSEVNANGKLQASSFTLQGMDGKTYKFEGPREKPIVLNFWASWCGPCREEAPDLKKMYETYEGKIDFYAVNLTSQDNKQDAAAFVKEYGFEFPILLDEKGEVANRYKIIGIPTTFFIDKNGVIQQTVMGMIDQTMVDEYMKKILP